MLMGDDTACEAQICSSWRWLLVAISGGAIINVAVACGCCYSRVKSGNRHYTDLPTAGEVNWWRQNLPVSVDCIPESTFRQRTFGREILWLVDHDYRQGIPAHDFNDVRAQRISAGWPWFALQGGEWRIKGVRRGQAFILQIDLRPAPRYRNIMLPLQPIFPGFAINTILYAAILWALFALPFAIRRRRRIKRGSCPACAYPVGVSPTCTECGATVQRAMIAFSPQRGAGM